MKTEPDIEALTLLQSLIERETGTCLQSSAVGEMKSIIRHAMGTAETADLSIERREVSILLADLRGFTALSTTLPEDRMTSMLNQCLEKMSEVIFRCQGTIDKFMGDAIMVLFGAPEEHEGDNFNAMLCAVEMQIAMRDLNVEFKKNGWPELFMGIGINTGKVMAGRFGSRLYSEYTVIGEEVNLAARIEAFSLRGQILISEHSYQGCADLISASDAMEVFVKGKPDPVRLRELTGIPGRNLITPRQEPRRSHRVEVQIPCTFQYIQNKIILAPINKATILDIGYYGIMLELDQAADERTEVKLEFDLAIVNYHVKNIYAKVVKLRRDGNHWHVGMEFTSVDAEASSKIRTFVQFMVTAK